MLAFGGDIVAGRKVLDDLDVGGETGARENSLEEIVAEERILGDAAGESPLEGVDVVDAFAGVRAFAEEVLVDVGDRRRIGIHPTGAGDDPLIERALAADRQRRRDARLKNCVTAHDPLLEVTEPRPIQRMGHLADQTERRVPRQSRVGIERDDVTHVGRHLRCLPVDRHERRIGGAAQEAVELV